MQRKVQFEVGEFYHIYNRGIDKRKIFFSTGDWIQFQRLLFICNYAGAIKPRTDRTKKLTLHAIRKSRKDKSYVDIVAYTMMPNHFHLLLSEKLEGGITAFMRKLMTSYVMYMNKKYNRTGGLMCRPFRSKHVDSDEYFRWLVTYIHLNPVAQIKSSLKELGVENKKEAQEFLKNYRYSSYKDYFVSDRDESLILSKDISPLDISDLEDIRDMLNEIENASKLDFTLMV
ncbi:MAG: transposase [Candidatus Pacebacteria bacterium]|nr:transposase [Candidatus Paceibacterota bacterium]